jgi:hypothetical protein
LASTTAVRLNDCLGMAVGLVVPKLELVGRQSALDRGCKCNRIGEKTKSILSYDRESLPHNKVES